MCNKQKVEDISIVRDRLFDQGVYLLKNIEEYISHVETANLTDEQFFLNWEDKLNELSIKSHNANPE